MTTLVFNANSSQNIAKGNKDSAAYCCIAWLGSLAFKRANAYKSIKTMEMKQNKIKHFFHLSLSSTRVSTKLLRPFSLYLQHSKLKFLLDRHLATHSFGLGRLFYKSSRLLQNFRRHGDYKGRNLEDWFSVYKTTF